MREQQMKKFVWLLGVFVLLFFTLTACGGSGSAAPTKSIPVQITETDFHITSSVTNFVPGKTYHFLVTNQGKVMHEFMIMPKVMGRMQGMSMTDMDKAALVHLDMIDPGETQTFTYTFPASMAGTHPEFACYVAGHYEAGMRLEVAVKAS
jgi:uncharacterized cupredoxin-like copper-binding protein